MSLIVPFKVIINIYTFYSAIVNDALRDDRRVDEFRLDEALLICLISSLIDVLFILNPL